MIAIFILMMQILWVYIDEIIGKGVSIFEIMEMVGYMMVSLVPKALPLGVLISAVMVFGGLSERYELSSMKSAGVSLWRIMAGAIAFGMLVSVFSYYCSNNIIPITNLKFMTRLQDISNQKPALNLEEGIFNDDFAGYAIKIKEKGVEGKNIYDVMIYDHRNARQGVVSVLTADRGEMYTTADEKYLVMKLYDGYQYQELEEKAGHHSDPVIRSNFKELTKLFDLSQFDLTKTDEDRYKTLETMLSANQLMQGIDSLQEAKASNKANLFETVQKFSPSQNDTNKVEKKVLKGSFQQRKPGKDALDTFSRKDSVQYADTLSQSTQDSMYSAVFNLLGEKNRARILSKAEGIATGRYNDIRSSLFKLERIEQSLSRHYYELHTKYAIALMCFFFVFIGAPMGAIIRKGGYGYPLLVSIIFYMVYIVLFIFTRQMSKSMTMDPILASWLPDAVMAPIGIYLTYKASKDSKFSGIATFFKKFIDRFRKNSS
jgi:lipopolysaccharide export system permease protein